MSYVPPHRRAVAPPPGFQSRAPPPGFPPPGLSGFPLGSLRAAPAPRVAPAAPAAAAPAAAAPAAAAPPSRHWALAGHVAASRTPGEWVATLAALFALATLRSLVDVAGEAAVAGAVAAAAAIFLKTRRPALAAAPVLGVAALGALRRERPQQFDFAVAQSLALVLPVLGLAAAALAQRHHRALRRLRRAAARMLRPPAQTAGAGESFAPSAAAPGKRGSRKPPRAKAAPAPRPPQPEDSPERDERAAPTRAPVSAPAKSKAARERDLAASLFK
ncbi:hypothetical protein M885DRAFT_615050 [Pelagophyceae sp. CCMP2097]|nr:hypothetical protein M885DRAFT_615050 [Pelagophyceae sp. CCMP2097]